MVQPRVEESSFRGLTQKLIYFPFVHTQAVEMQSRNIEKKIIFHEMTLCEQLSRYSEKHYQHRYAKAINFSEQLQRISSSERRKRVNIL